jgi:hypothetical protein
MVKRFSPVLIIAVVAAIVLFRRRDNSVDGPDSVWTPVDPS